jgi:hypothetical protein
MTIDRQAVAARDVMTSSNQTRSTAMNLMHQELARAQLASQYEHAAHVRRSNAYLAHRRWQRRAEQAARRARLALLSL